MIGFAAVIVFAISMFFWAAGGAKDSTLVNGMMGNELALDSKDADKTDITQNPFDAADVAESDNRPVSDPAVDAVQSDNDDLKKQRLPSHIYESTLDDVIKPASVVMMGGNCIAMNRYGERLNLDDGVCELMIADSSMMPKARKAAMPVASSNVQAANSVVQ